MALTATRVIDNQLEIRFDVNGPHNDTIIPTLELGFNIRRFSGEFVAILPFQYEASLGHPKMILGTQCVLAVVDNHISPVIHKTQGKGLNYYSNLEIGWEKLGIILKDGKGGDKHISIRIFGVYILENESRTRSFNFGTYFHRVLIPESEWLKWLSQWMTEYRTLVVENETYQRCNELKEILKLDDDELLLRELLDNYPTKP